MSVLSAGELEKLRAVQHSSEMYLSVLVPDDAMTARVNGSPDRGNTVIPYDGDSGEDDVLAGMVAWFGTTEGGHEIGIARVKSIDTGADELTLEENDLVLVDDAYITVKKVWLPRAKLPNIDTSGAAVTFTKDGETYTDQNENIPPVINMGPPACAFCSLPAWLAGTGNAGKIYRRDESAANWNEIYDSAANTIGGIAVGLNGVICAAGSDGKVYRSTDNGETWSAIAVDTTLAAIATDGAGIWCATGSSSGRIQRSTDNGATWAQVYTVALSVMTSISTDGAGVWCAGNAITQKIYRSSDNGATWAEIYDTGDSITAIATDGAGVWCATSANGAIYSSSDNGENWGLPIVLGSAYVYALATDRAGNWLAGDGNGDIYSSSDNGENWGLAYSAAVSVRSIATNGAGNWLAGTGSGTIQQSDDNGATWAAAGSAGSAVSALAYNASGSAIVKFVDELSWSPVGAALSTKTWAYGGGTAVGGTGTVAVPYIVRFSAAGVYWVSLTITDANGATSVGYRPVLIYDENNLPYTEFQSNPRRLSLRGNRQEFTVFGDADLDHFPDGAWVVRWNKNYYDSTLYEMDTRYPYRGDVVFAGFLVGDSVRTDTNVSQTTFEAVGVTTLLEQMPGFGDVLIDTASPTSWVEMKSLDVIKAALHVLRWSTTVLDVCDLRYSLARAAGEIKIAEQRWGAGSIFQQIDQVLNQKGIFANLCADAQGSLHIGQDPLLMDHDDRAAAVTTVVDFAVTDWATFDVQERQHEQLRQVRLSGIAYDGSTATPYASRAPGTPATHPASQDVGGQVLIDQDDTNRLAGDVYAKLNNRIASATLTLPGNWDVFDPALQERITVTLTAAQNNRELAYTSSDYWIVREVAVNEDAARGLVREVQLTLERETEGIPGIGGTVRTQPVWVIAEPDPEPAARSAISAWPGVVVGTEAAGVFCANPLAGDDTEWIALNTGLSGDALKVTDLILIKISGQETVFASTDAGIFKYTSLPSTSGTWTEVQSLAALKTAAGGGAMTIQPLYLHFSATNPGYAWLTVRRTTSPYTLYVYETQDNFATITNIDSTATSYTSTSPLLYGNVWSVPGDPTVWYFCASINTSGGDYYSRLWKRTSSSLDKVDELTSTAGTAGHCWCYVPKSSLNSVYWGRDKSASDPLRGSTNAGGSFSDLSSLTSLRRIYGPASRSVLTIQTTAQMYDYTIATSTLNAFGTSYSGLLSSKVRSRLSPGTINTVLVAGRWSWPYTNSIAIDNSTTVTDQTGNGAFGDNITCIARQAYE